MKSNFRLFLLFLIFIPALRCSKDPGFINVNLNPWPVYGSLTDLDGNSYKTRLLGSQTWMAENLKTTKYSDGTPIPVITNAASWSNIIGPACCWQENNPDFKVKYGVLYNWYAVSTKKLCPAGWHIPTDEEWTQLTEYVGGEMTAGGKLKESGFRHWITPNSGATDEYAFRALPGGSFDLSDSLFQSIQKIGCW